jgi:DNA-binding MarR family transcriptional regulator
MLAPMPTDSVDALLESWRLKRPDLDFSPVGIVARLARVRGHIARELDPVFDAHGLGAASFGVLVTLARIEDEGGVSQRRLMDELGLTSGTISVRMDRLVAQGLVERRPDPDSRRNTLITLTERGRELFERVVPAHLANERRLLAALDADERELLAGLLRKLLVEFEGARLEAPAVGLVVAPAHVTMAMRESVGLEPVPGLLVRAVDRHGAACAAGVRTGDVLLAAGRRELRSAASLSAAIDAARPGGRLGLRVLRGAEESDLVVMLGAQPAAAATPGRGEHAV